MNDDQAVKMTNALTDILHSLRGLLACLEDEIRLDSYTREYYQAAKNALEDYDFFKAVRMALEDIEAINGKVSPTQKEEVLVTYSERIQQHLCPSEKHSITHSSFYGCTCTFEKQDKIRRQIAQELLEKGLLE